MRNTTHRYGPVTKALHWLTFLLVVNQFVVAWVMMRLGEGETWAGYAQGPLYEWHKSIGLVLLAVFVVRFGWRQFTEYPDWAPNLSPAERRWIGATERTLYLCLFLMPASGFVFVMAGGYGIVFLNRWDVPFVIGQHETMARAAQWTHLLTAWLLVAALLAHWGLTFRHQSKHRDRYVQRMLPFTHQR